MAVTLLSKRLRDKISKFDSTDLEWELFVKDHRDELLANATAVAVSSDEMRKYRYSIEEFLGAKKFDKGLAWITLWINQLRSNLEFTTQSLIHVPDKRHVEKLYEQYMTFKKYLSE